MKKRKMPRKARKPTMAMRLDEAERRAQSEHESNAILCQKIANHDREEGRLANENTRLSKIIEGLKEELFNKSLLLARAEGTLERVDHEDAERAEVVMVQDYQATRMDHRSGEAIAGPPFLVHKAVLKYDLAKPMMHSTGYALTPSSLRDQYGRETEREKHWVNRH